MTTTANPQGVLPGKPGPFRADQVGSLLRSPPLKEARAAHAEGRLDALGLRTVEDAEIKKLIARQEAVGLHAVTDGEYRRSRGHDDFLWQLDGVTRAEPDQGTRCAGMPTGAEAPRATGRIGFSGHPFIEHFKFLNANTSHTAKMTIPSPSMLHDRCGRTLIDTGLYPDMAGYHADLGQAYRSAIGAFHNAGCRYLQLDDASFASLCDPAQKHMPAQRGDDPDRQGEIYAAMVAAALEGRPQDMLIAIHLCRGHFRSAFVASEPVADLLFNAMPVDAYFMEWDSERAGGFAPLRFLPRGKVAVLGLVTTRPGVLESKDDIKRRIDEAARHVPLEQLCLSPQCGFASTDEGNDLAEDEQWRKLELIVEVAREVWW